MTANILPCDVYTPEAVAACEKALRTLLRRIGPWGQKVVLVGGMAPRYLVPQPANAVGPHPGTTDLDVVIGVAVEDSPECYKSLAKNLKDCDFAPLRKEDGTPSSWQWQRQVDGISVVVEFLCPDIDGRLGRLKKNPAEGIGSEISALQVQGAHLVGVDFVEIDLAGELLDEGGVSNQPICLRVANFASYLTLKAFALRDRLKEKDAFDIVWILTAHPEGPIGVRACVDQSPIAGTEEVKQAIGLIAEKFASPSHEGSASFAKFVLGLSGRTADAAPEDAARLRRDAHGAVRAFLAAATG